MNKQVEFQDLNKILEIWNKKNWNQRINQDFVFENICELLNNLNAEQRELIHQLIENYLWLSNTQYEIKFNEIFNEVYKNSLKKCKDVYLVPVVKPFDRRKIKSSDHCVYLVKSILKFNRNYSKFNIIIGDDFDQLKTKAFASDGTEVILFIDDFIGTGDSFEKGWLDISLVNNTITNKNSFLICLILQEVAFLNIQSNFQFQIFYDEIRKKGISDFFSSSEKIQKIQIMKDIEEIIKPGKHYSFGYKASEALVTMLNTPNNTFPVFWKKYKIKDKEYYPPFIRN